MHLQRIPTVHPFRDWRTGKVVRYRVFTAQPVPVQHAKAIAARVKGARVRVFPAYRGACVYVPSQETSA